MQYLYNNSCVCNLYTFASFNIVLRYGLFYILFNFVISFLSVSNCTCAQFPLRIVKVLLILMSCPEGRSSPALDPLQKSPPVESSAPLASSVSSTTPVPVSRRSPITSRLSTTNTQKASDAPEQRRVDGRSRLRSGLGHAAGDSSAVHSGFQSAGMGRAKPVVVEKYVFSSWNVSCTQQIAVV